MKKLKKNQLKLDKEVISSLSENDLFSVRGGGKLSEGGCPFQPFDPNVDTNRIDCVTQVTRCPQPINTAMCVTNKIMCPDPDPIPQTKPFCPIKNTDNNSCNGGLCTLLTNSPC